MLKDATLKLPDNNWEFKGGRKGMHSEHLGHLLAQMQYMQRAYQTWNGKLKIDMEVFGRS